MKTSLCAGAVLLALVLTGCGGGEEQPSGPASSEPSASADSPSESSSDSATGGAGDLAVPTDAICAGLDVADLSAALGVDLRVRADLTIGETSPVSGIAVLAPQCSLRGGGKSLDLSVFADDATATLGDDVAEGIAAAEESGAVDCQDVRDLDASAYDGRETVAYDCEVPASEVDATTVVVRMAPDWRIQCALTGPGLAPAASRTRTQDACAVVVDSLAG